MLRLPPQGDCRADDGADAGAADPVDVHSGLVQRPVNADLAEPARCARTQHQPRGLAGQDAGQALQVGQVGAPDVQVIMRTAPVQPWSGIPDGLARPVQTHQVFLRPQAVVRPQRFQHVARGIRFGVCVRHQQHHVRLACGKGSPGGLAGIALIQQVIALLLLVRKPLLEGLADVAGGRARVDEPPCFQVQTIVLRGQVAGELAAELRLGAFAAQRQQCDGMRCPHAGGGPMLQHARHIARQVQ